MPIYYVSMNIVYIYTEIALFIIFIFLVKQIRINPLFNLMAFLPICSISVFTFSCKLNQDRNHIILFPLYPQLSPWYKVNNQKYLMTISESTCYQLCMCVIGDIGAREYFIFCISVFVLFFVLWDS